MLQVAKFLTCNLESYIPITNFFNINSTPTFIENLKEIPVYENIRLQSLNVRDMYTNIPTGKLTL